MHPNDRDPAFGIIVAAAIGAPVWVAIVAAVAWLAEPVLRHAAWVVLVIKEIAG